MASKEGWRCAGNLVVDVGSGGGERKGGMGKSWKRILDSSDGSPPLKRSLTWRLWLAEAA